MGQTPLHWASKRGNKEIVDFLIKKGADFDAVDVLGRSALQFAVKYQNNNCVIVK